MADRAQQFQFSPGFPRTPGFLRRGYVKAEVQGKVDLLPVDSPCTITSGTLEASNSGEFGQISRR